MLHGADVVTALRGFLDLDPDERLAAEAVLKQVGEWRGIEMRNLARAIAGELSRLFR